MTRLRGLSLALTFTALLIPAVAQAQQRPRDTKYTKDAAKFIGLAMMRPDAEYRTKMYTDALAALQEGFERDAQNPKFWFVAGQAYAGLGQVDKAGEAFSKAVELYPEYEAEVEGERESAWMHGFERAVALMDQQKYDEALVLFEASNALYPHRPEGWLNIGSIYANNKNDVEKAVHAFEQAIATTKGPLLEKLDSAGKAQWASYAEMSAVNIGQMRGAQGVERFQEEKFTEAEELFRKAAEMNPHSRDFLFNIVQSRYAQTTKLEEQIEANPEARGQLAPQLIPLYEGLRTEIRSVLALDPNSEVLYMILARSTKRQHELNGDTLAAQQQTLAILTELEKLPVDVDQVSIVPAADGASAEITGQVKGRSAAPGSMIKLNLTLLDRSGGVIGQQEISVSAPEKEGVAEFKGTAQLNGTIAGWKYQVTT